MGPSEAELLIVWRSHNHKNPQAQCTLFSPPWDTAPAEIQLSGIGELIFKINYDQTGKYIAASYSKDNWAVQIYDYKDKKELFEIPL